MSTKWLTFINRCNAVAFYTVAASFLAYSSIGKQLQTKFLSPYALSTLLTDGQNFASFTK